jgi:hypothetical protein
MDKPKLRNLFIMTILIIIIIFSLVLVMFNTIEGMAPYQFPYNHLIQGIQLN